MKRIINGKRYNTETATTVATASWGSAGDFRAFQESLYLTQRGNWFLAGEGGPLTKWARPAEGGGTCGGAGIIPMTENDALDWLEFNREEGAIEEYFHDQIEDA